VNEEKKPTGSELTAQLIEDLMCYRFGPIWDGNVNSKSIRDRLVDLHLIYRECGFQFLSPNGITVLKYLGLLNESTWRRK
jgi:hypothetical protein